jgi:hypothetical protein
MFGDVSSVDARPNYRFTTSTFGAHLETTIWIIYSLCVPCAIEQRIVILAILESKVSRVIALGGPTDQCGRRSTYRFAKVAIFPKPRSR